jgi:cyclopropane fatty-acyl-phospholipid synthase-like methyltransferase
MNPAGADAKPHAPATERNREAIAEVLHEHFADRRRVLEIGSGTGQHAVYFARLFPHLTWQTSDRRENLDGITAWLQDARLPNTPAALQLDVNGAWPAARYDAVFSANTLHIMSWQEVEQLFAGLSGILTDDARLVIYGPFNYNNQFTSESNRDFDCALKTDAPHRGIRDFAAVDALARAIGLDLLADLPMPANNRCLVWRRQARAEPGTGKS